MPSISLQHAAAALLLSSVTLSCGAPSEEDRAVSGPIKGPFVVSQHFTPSGLMGDGAIPDQVTVHINAPDCKKPRPPGAQGDCYHVLWNVKKADVWAGIFWVFPSNNWGSVPGRQVIGPVDKGIDATTGKQLWGYTRVRFYAAADKMPIKDPFFTYWAGGLDGREAKPPQPYYDLGCSVFPGTPAVCKDESRMPPVPLLFEPIQESGNLGVDWKQYQIDLSQWSVEQLIGAFGFATNDTDNPASPMSMYFDDIVWE